jgi:hypothetical protein
LPLTLLPLLLACCQSDLLALHANCTLYLLPHAQASQTQGGSPRARIGILRKPGVGGSTDDLRRLQQARSERGAPASPTVSWHRSVTDRNLHRRPPLSSIFPSALSPRRVSAELLHSKRRTAMLQGIEYLLHMSLLSGTLRSILGCPLSTAFSSVRSLLSVQGAQAISWRAYRGWQSASAARRRRARERGTRA